MSVRTLSVCNFRQKLIYGGIKQPTAGGEINCCIHEET